MSITRSWPIVARRLVALACATSLACASGVSTIRLGQPVALEPGAPATECERRAWVEMVPARSFASQTDQTGGGQGWVQTTTVSERVPGYGLYRFGEARALDLRDVLPRLGEPALAADHLFRIRSILRREERSRRLAKATWILLSASLLALVIGSSSYDPDDNTVWSIGLTSGLVLSLGSLVTLFWGRAIRPSVDERAYALTRKYVLVPGEDDLDAAARGVARFDREVRTRCGGAP